MVPIESWKSNAFVFDLANLCKSNQYSLIKRITFDGMSLTQKLKFDFGSTQTGIMNVPLTVVF